MGLAHPDGHPWTRRCRGCGPYPLARPFAFMKVTLHPSIKSITGTLDDWVYRRVGDQIVVAGRPGPSTKPETEPQRAGRQRFAAAVAYAKTVLADPYQREAYAELARRHGRRADKLLTSDYLTPPEIRRIGLEDYTGQPGGQIRILAMDDIEVVSVEVAIATTAGAELERGPCVNLHGVWCYTATSLAPAGAALQITVSAQDRPGNTTRSAVVFPG